MDSVFKNVKDERNNNSLKLQIVLAADCAVGKTAFISRLYHKNFHDYMERDRCLNATLGFDSYLFILNYKGITVELTIWDTEWLGSIRLFSQREIYERADIVFIFYQSSSRYSFDKIIHTKYFFDEYCKRNTIFALIRNKYDLYREEISDEEVLEFADKNNMLFFHLSLHEKMKLVLKNYLKMF